MEEIKVPPMGESISEAVVGSIFKKSGSMVSIDEEILELETDKVNQVIYATADGLLSLEVQQGQTVSMGDLIGTIDTSKRVVEAKELKPLKEGGDSPGVKTLPLEPKLSVKEERQQVEVSVLESEKSGEGSLDRGESEKERGNERETRKKMPRIRRVIAERLLESVKSTAMLTTFNEVDMSQVMEIREKNKETFQKVHGVKLGFMSFFVKAVVSALKAYPIFNTYIDGEEIVQRHYVDIAIAVGTERGLVVPVLRQSDKLSFANIETSIAMFAEKARSGKLGADDLVGGSFTISNGGTYGSMLSTPILNPPQCGILGMHKIQKRAVVVRDQIAVRPIMYVALSYDHRVVDGKEAVSFLVHIKNEIEDPSRLILDI